MHADELKRIQKPLKRRYRDDPDAARLTLSAEAILGSDNPTCSVATGRAMVEAGLHPAMIARPSPLPRVPSYPAAQVTFKHSRGSPLCLAVLPPRSRGLMRIR